MYSAILDFTVKVKKGQDENEASKIIALHFSKTPRSFEADYIQERTLESVMALTGQPLQILKVTINSQAQLAKEWTELAANLGELQVIPRHGKVLIGAGDRKCAAEHLAKTDTLLINMKTLASKLLTVEEES